MILHPRSTYVHLSPSGNATPVEGGEKFWSLPAAQLEAFGQGWLISEYEFDSDWPNWEMHPHADEFVYLLSGSVDMLLETSDGIERVQLRGTGAILVPCGIWHTAKVLSPSRMLHVTLGKGTSHRPAT